MAETSNWTLEFSQAHRNLLSLYSQLGWEPHSHLQKVAEKYPIFIPRRLASLIQKDGPDGVLAREFLPSFSEIAPEFDQGLEDPIGDRTYHRAPQLIHRYSSRALFTPTTVCPVHCRYCFRKNELYQQDDIFAAEFETTLNYLREHPEISEIIFTGGDPFTLSDAKLRHYLESFATISHIKDIRFHTRYPVILPERMNEALLNLLQEFSHRFRTLSIAIHANHVKEFDYSARESIQKLSATSIQLLSQTVLLKGVNDDETSLLELMNLFLDLKIRPYYLHHPDRVKGGMHFYLPLETGRRLYGKLRQHLPGWAIPHYVIDVPGGAGKINAFNPESLSYSGNLLSSQGEIFSHPEPSFDV